MKYKFLKIKKTFIKEYEEVKAFLTKDKFNMIVLGISLLILVIGTIIFNFFIGLLIFCLIN